MLTRQSTMTSRYWPHMEELNGDSGQRKDTEHSLRHREPLTADGAQEHFGVGVAEVTSSHLHPQRGHHLLHLLLISVNTLMQSGRAMASQKKAKK